MGGILLVAGTTIGAAMLALPVVTGFAGFWPSILFFVFYWIYMTFTALLLLEVNLWMGEHTNLTTMAKKTLGKTWQFLSWIIYLFLLYALTTAYIAGGGQIFLEFFEGITGKTFSHWFGALPLLLVFGFFVYQGARSVDYVNRFLMITLAITFGLIVVILSPHTERNLLGYYDLSALWIGVSIVSTSFGFHIIIPTLNDYLQRDVALIRKVIWIGGAIPLVVYCIWEFLTLGIIPLEGPNGLAGGFAKGLDGATLLSMNLGNSRLGLFTQFFSLLAIITSFLGVSLSLRDFLADGLKIHKNRKGKLILYLLTFVPPFLITLFDHRAFINALEYAGAFGVVTLLGLFPALMVWRGRYVQNRIGPYRTPGGKVLLSIIIFISVSVITLEIINKVGYLQDPPIIDLNQQEISS